MRLHAGLPQRGQQVVVDAHGLDVLDEVAASCCVRMCVYTYIYIYIYICMFYVYV